MLKLAQKLSFLAVLSFPGPGLAEAGSQGGHATPYAGLQDREIKSLSAGDIAELMEGSGWGLALPAELNGLPGPAHLLELKDDIGLSQAQIEAITEIFTAMRAEAMAAGRRFIEAEAALSDAFANGQLSEEHLAGLLAEAAEARAALRFIHLSRHLTTPALLTEAQIRKYSILRGYADDPCTKVPEGHDPAQWRRHNGCD